jgi:CO/xanthine dehydrogenase Mo-binding subunit
MSASRREFLRASGFLIASGSALSVEDLSALVGIGAQNAPGPYPDPDFLQLDSWIVIRQDNTATFFVGKTDLGQGTGTAFRQIMCDELDMAYDKTSCVMGSTHNTVDQGGSGGSDAL